MTEQAIQHFVMQVPPLAVEVPSKEGKGTLTVRLDKGMKRRFVTMAAQMGVTQQFLIETWMAAALDEYDKFMASKRARKQ